MENLNIAFLLMAVGMLTVFAVLLIVIYLGKLLIALVDKYAPEEAVAVQPGKQAGKASVPPHLVAVITAAVNVITHNKGKVTGIEPKD
jgi:oxaloacetate decarboxylase gamma subunit